MNLPKWLVSLSADIHFSKYPMWVQYKPTQHKIKGHEAQRVIDTVEVGDLVFGRHDGYLNTYLTPGFWGHVGLVVSPTEVIHSTGKGVSKETLLDFCRTDNICVAQLKGVTLDEIQAAITEAHTLIGLGYDYQFETNDSEYYCSELVDHCYGNPFAPYYTKQPIGNEKILDPSAMLDCDLLNVTLDIRK